MCRHEKRDGSSKEYCLSIWAEALPSTNIGWGFEQPAWFRSNPMVLIFFSKETIPDSNCSSLRCVELINVKINETKKGNAELIHILTF